MGTHHSLTLRGMNATCAVCTLESIEDVRVQVLFLEIRLKETSAFAYFLHDIQKYIDIHGIHDMEVC